MSVERIVWNHKVTDKPEAITVACEDGDCQNYCDMCPIIEESSLTEERLIKRLNEPTKQRKGDQPLPAKSDLPVVHDLLCAEIQSRKTIGIARYGVGLQPHNGRDVLRDLLEELLDAAAYTRQLMYERDEK